MYCHAIQRIILDLIIKVRKYECFSFSRVINISFSFFIMVSLLMTIVTIFLVPKSIGQYVIFNEYWLKLIIFICYMAINMLIFGNAL